MLKAEDKKGLKNNGIFSSKSVLASFFARIAKRTPAAFLGAPFAAFKRLSNVPFFSVLVLMLLALFCSGSLTVYAAVVVDSVGNTQNSNQRKVIATPNGYVIVVGTGSDSTVAYWSYTGEGPWTSTNLFRGLGGAYDTDVGIKPNIWYEGGISTKVIAAVSTSRAPDRPAGYYPEIFIRRFNVSSTGIQMVSNQKTSNITPSVTGCLRATLGSGGFVGQNWPVGLMVHPTDSTNKVWISGLLTDNGALPGVDMLDGYIVYDDNLTDPAGTWRFDDGDADCSEAGTDNDSLAYPVLLPHPVAAQRVIAASLDIANVAAVTPRIHQNEDSYADAGTGNPTFTGLSCDQTGFDNNVSMLTDSAGNLHAVWVDCQEDIWYGRINNDGTWNTAWDISYGDANLRGDNAVGGQVFKNVLLSCISSLI